MCVTPAERLVKINAELATGAIGHSSSAHAVHGWCALCPARTLAHEVAAWRMAAGVEARTAEVRRTPPGPGATIVVDFDGVLFTYDQGWQGGDIYGGPTQGSAEAMAELLEGYAVVVGTARTELGVVAEAIRRWYDVATVVDTPEGRYPFWNTRGVVLVTGRKVPALAYVDDRAILCAPLTGDGWHTALEHIRRRHGHRAAAGPPVLRPVRGQGGENL